MADFPPLSERDHIRGPGLDAESALTILHYGDFECPSSRQVEQIVRETLKVFPDRVRFVFRHFPIRIHPNALAAAEAAEAAAAQGRFWAYHDHLFANQLALSDNDLVLHADAVGLDAREVRIALDEAVYREKVLGQKRAAVRAGVRHTMNLIIEGALYEEDAVEDALIEQVIRPLRDQER